MTSPQKLIRILDQKKNGRVFHAADAFWIRRAIARGLVEFFRRLHR